MRDAPRIDDLFPPEVRTASSAPVDCEDELFPEERALVARAAASRRREFATARVCARRLLAQLGAPERPLLRAEDRSPLWPSGFTGSISHCHDLCVVAVARCESLCALGVDVEPAGALEPELWTSLCTPRELAWIHDQQVAVRGRQVRLLFSAKESAYKTVARAAGADLGFHDFEVDLELDAGRFTATWRSGGPQARGGSCNGAFAFRSRWVFTASSIVSG